MTSKKRSPYGLEKDYWDDLPPDARNWIERYAKAAEFGNFNVLRELCDEAPSERFEEIKAEVIYERDFYKRDQYTVPVSRHPRYSEHDYSWIESMREHYPETDAVNKLGDVYESRPTAKNMKWAK